MKSFGNIFKYFQGSYATPTFFACQLDVPKSANCVTVAAGFLDMWHEVFGVKYHIHIDLMDLVEFE